MWRAIGLTLFISCSLPALGAEPPSSPLPPTAAVNQMKLPEGFHVSVFAAEPDVVQPIAFTIDDRGRLWVVECVSYPEWTADGTGRDRVLIFEDADGDGQFDSRKVFADQLGNVSGIAVGFGGVFLTATPNFLFIPDKNGDDAPDGPAEVLLDGWDLKAKHNVFNGLTWGPDGWLYGCNGILSNSKVGPPGTSDEKRIEFNCGVWRFHPTRQTFEVFARGTTNPWGLDFDEFGQMFITNCVIGHLWHVVPGAHFRRMHGEDLNPHVYGLLESCADHIHWGGGKWQDSRGGEGIHDKPGGGHAHAGCMIYLADNWPKEYRGKLFTHNIHGQRINCDELHRRGSGYVAHHDDDFLFAGPSWFRGLELMYGPDGGVFMTDWNDTGECHDYENTQKQTGRIYKITYGKTEPAKIDLAKLSSMELYRLQFHSNAWYVRHSRRLLQELASAGTLDDNVIAQLRRDMLTRPDPIHRLRAMWTLHSIEALTEDDRFALLSEQPESIRGWAVRLELEDRKASQRMMNRLTDMAANDSSPVVRLELAAGLQRLPLSERWTLAEKLMAHSDDAKDDYLPLMIWYGIEPLVAADRTRAVQLIVKSQIPLIREYISRRLAASE